MRAIQKYARLQKSERANASRFLFSDFHVGIRIFHGWGANFHFKWQGHSLVAFFAQLLRESFILCRKKGSSYDVVSFILCRQHFTLYRNPQEKRGAPPRLL